MPILIVIVAFIVWAGAIVGNYLGDAATLKDCATTGQAVMSSGGTIQCSVMRSTK